MHGTSVQSSSQSESRWLRIHATDLAHKELACEGKHVHTHAHPRTHMHAHTHKASDPHSTREIIKLAVIACAGQTAGACVKPQMHRSVT